jgi:hypothetical protein
MRILMVDTDFNGIVFFDPALLRAQNGGSIAPGTDLFTRYTETDEGDAVIAAGVILPLLAIDDGGYEIVVRRSDEEPPALGEIVAQNGAYRLRVQHRLMVADLAVLKDWEDELGWQDCDVAPGEYSAEIRGFRETNVDGRITRAGYELALQRVSELPAPTADLSKNLRLFR